MENPDRLSTKVVHGGIWVLSLRLITRLVTVVRMLVLARFIVPEQFGLIGIALLFTGMLETFTVTGLDVAMVQRSSDESNFWDTAWMTAVVRGIILAALVFLAAPWVASFFGKPDAVLLIRVMGLAPLLKGFTNLGVMRYIKEMQFQRRFVYELGISLADAAVAIPIAVIYRNAWALAIGVLAGQITGVIISWIVSPLGLRLCFDRDAFRKLFGYGRWVSASSILNFLVSQGDDAVVGRMLGASSMGLYQMAYRLSSLPATEISQVISNVTFPAYSKLQDSPERVGAAFLRVVRFIPLVSFPLGISIAILGPDFVREVMGPNWEGMIPCFRVLAIYGLVFSLGSCMGPVFTGIGRPDVLTKLQLFKFLVMLSLIFPMTWRFDLLGVAWTVTISELILIPASSYLVMRQVGLDLMLLVKELWLSLAMALIVTAALAAVIYLIEPGLARLIIGGAAASLAFLAGIYLLERTGHLGLVAELRYSLLHPQ